MIVSDPIYGTFKIPKHLMGLLSTPEVRRLSQVRLSNCLSPSLATLGELRRYSHTLGVLYLSLQNGLNGFSDRERRAFHASVLLHDVGTPPFGHSFEYETGWDHEAVIKAILRGHAVPENKAHQIFGGRSIRFERELSRVKISLTLVQEILKGHHPLSSLLFGVIDLDNVDNVARMSWALGLPYKFVSALELAKRISVRNDHSLTLSEKRGRDLVDEWAEARRRCYEIILFDEQNVAAQAVLSDTMRLALEKNILTEDDWDLTDEELLFLLRKHSITKGVIINEYLGRLPTLVFAVQLSGKLEDLGFPDLSAPKAIIEDVLRHLFPRQRPLGYAFVDSGTFQKEVTLHDKDEDRAWKHGKKSESVILYAFLRPSEVLSNIRCYRAAEDLIRTIGVADDKIIRFQIHNTKESHSGQRAFAFTTEKD